MASIPAVVGFFVDLSCDSKFCSIQARFSGRLWSDCARQAIDSGWSIDFLTSASLCPAHSTNLLIEKPLIQ